MFTVWYALGLWVFPSAGVVDPPIVQGRVDGKTLTIYDI